ncbi:JAB domain-containing protein [Altererythrobacter arenosus]|uniref:JAB domain-containing protein n=1 Tax=Altererythrobacter arenosus TaxID=3032592 RepID=A0ABY8FQE9_9SPHN|nr:JAB domain-containing protein [Altererythrobacter sp. CAU 1644]WFL76128.1 JAB domain-containing protein [Altererythrobacter sp. CAU 1644]
MNAIATVAVPDANTRARSDVIVEFFRMRLVPEASRQENFHALFLDSKRRLVGEKAIRGHSSDCIRTRSREIFAEALAARASGLIIAHNHPSGHCKPSRADIEATRKLSDIARALDIELLDHLIITDASAYSMRAGGLL